MGGPCAYVSAGDVAPVVGGPVYDGAPATAGGNWNGAQVCVFMAQSRFVVAIPDANVDFNSATVGFLDQATYMRLIAPPTPFSGVQPVAGYGSEAFEVAAPHYEVLFVHKGAFHVVFEVDAGKGSFFLPEERLARIVVPRLPA